MEQQVIGLPRHHAAAQPPQPPGQPRPLPPDQRPDGGHIVPFAQGGQARRLGRRRDRPGLTRLPQTVQQRAVGAQGIPQPQPRHAVQLGKSLEDQQAAGGQKALEGMGLGPVQKAAEAFIHHQQGPCRPAPGQDPFQQRAGGGQAGGIIGFAEEHQIHPGPDGLQETFPQPEILLLPQRKALGPAAHGRQGALVFRKGGGGHQSPGGAQGQGRPPDQIRRTVAAQHPLRGRALGPGDGSGQLPAQGVGVAVAQPRAFRHRPRRSGSQAQRADVG